MPNYYPNGQGGYSVYDDNWNLMPENVPGGPPQGGGGGGDFLGRTRSMMPQWREASVPASALPAGLQQIGGAIRNRNRDSKLIAAEPGEYVIKKDAAQRIGYDNLDEMNYGGGSPGRARLMSYGPVVGEHHRAAMYGPRDNPLQPFDVAVSPNMGLSLGDWIEVGGRPRRVADWSYFEPGRPTQNTIEQRDVGDLGYGSWRRLPGAPEGYQEGGEVLQDIGMMKGMGISRFPGGKFLERALSEEESNGRPMSDEDYQILKARVLGSIRGAGRRFLEPVGLEGLLGGGGAGSASTRQLFDKYGALWPEEQLYPDFEQIAPEPLVAHQGGRVPGYQQGGVVGDLWEDPGAWSEPAPLASWADPGGGVPHPGAGLAPPTLGPGYVRSTGPEGPSDFRGAGLAPSSLGEFGGPTYAGFGLRPESGFSQGGPTMIPTNWRNIPGVQGAVPGAVYEGGRWAGGNVGPNDWGMGSPLAGAGMGTPGMGGSLGTVTGYSVGQSGPMGTSPGDYHRVVGSFK